MTELPQQLDISVPSGESDDNGKAGRDDNGGGDEAARGQGGGGHNKDGEGDDERASSGEGGGRDEKRSRRRSKVSVGDAIGAAQEVVASLAGHRPESVSGVTRSEDGGWTVALDVVELSRIPPSTDMMATYEVALDGDGELVEFERVRRFVRSQAGED